MPPQAMVPIHFVGEILVFILGLAFLLVWNGARQNQACLHWGVAHLAMAVAAASGYTYQQNGQIGLAALSTLSISLFLVALHSANTVLLGRGVSWGRMAWQTVGLMVVIASTGFGFDQLAGRVLVNLLIIAVYAWSAYLFFSRFKLRTAAMGFAYKALSFAAFFLDMAHFSTYDREGWITINTWAGSVVLALFLVSVAVYQNRRLLEQTLKHLPDAVVARRVDGTILFCNDRYAELAGFASAAAAMGQSTVQATWNTEATQALVDEVNDALAHGALAQPRVFERNIPTRDGRRLDIEVVVSSFTDFGQQALVGVLRDLTARRQAERDKEALIRDTSQRFERIYASMLDGFVYTDLEGRVRQSNHAFEAMLGYMGKELLGLHYEALTPAEWHPVERRIVREEVLVRGHSSIFEKQFVHKNGQAFPAEVRIYLDNDDQGRAIGFWAIVRNITQRKADESALKELNAALEDKVRARTQQLEEALQSLKATQQDLIQSEKMASLGAMVAGVAHELNTPIGNALLMASSLQSAQADFLREVDQGLRKSSLERFLEHVGSGAQIIERSLGRAADLVQSFKQVAVDQSSYQRREFELNEVVHETLTALGPMLRHAHVVVHESVPAQLRMDSWPGPLVQVLMNLINNAVLHGFEGRPGRIDLTVQQPEPEQIEITVADDGVGIAGVDLPKVFDPFYTTKLGRGGSGLGLHIVYTLVTGLLGGRISMQSQLGQGTQVLIRLPLQAPKDAERS